MILLSHFQAAPLLKAIQRGETSAETTLDLNLSRTTVTLGPDGVILAEGVSVAAEELAEIADVENGCFLIEADSIRRVQLFSEETGRYYSLMPTTGAPTMLISGIPMHRIKGTEPHADTLAKIRAAGPVRGRVLDTTTGLGYTALEAARTADHVTTVELDPAVHEIIRSNPWSRRLFDTPNITPLIGDSSEVILTFADGAFDVIIHDPPMFSLAGDLYSLNFYRQLHRVLARRGRLFHYIGNPESKSGAVVTRGVVRRLQEAGFARVTPKADAFGVAAWK